jgi:hypothetical protein
MTERVCLLYRGEFIGELERTNIEYRGTHPEFRHEGELECNLPSETVYKRLDM